MSNSFLQKEFIKILIEVFKDMTEEDILKSIIKEKHKKLRFTLIPLEALEDVITVIQNGAEKYGIDCWKFLPVDIFEDALYRHYSEHLKGNYIDSEWNLPHLAHLIANGLFLLWKYKVLNNIENKGELKSNEALENIDGVDN